MLTLLMRHFPAVLRAAPALAWSLACIVLLQPAAGAEDSTPPQAAGRQEDKSPEPPALPPSHSVSPELYATGFAFAEGPALNAAGDLFVVNYRRTGTIGRIAADGTARIFCDLTELAPAEGSLVRANGLKIDGEGRLIASDAGAGRLLRIAADGRQVEVLADRCNGKRLNSINDVALDLAGNVYFSDPGNSTAEKPTGAIYRYSIDTGSVTLLDEGLAYPNGIGVTPDQTQLCLSESGQRRLLAYRLAADGTVGERRILLELPQDRIDRQPCGPHVPDGFVFDAQGRLYLATWTGGVIDVIDPATGRLLRQYDAGGSKVTNCHFHGGYLYTTIAAKEAVFRLKLGIAGFRYSGVP